MSKISEIVLQRKSEIIQCIKLHERNIKLLHFHAIHQRKILNRGIPFRIVSFDNLGRSEARYRWSVKQLTMQIILLQNELSTLKIYGEEL